MAIDRANSLLRPPLPVPFNVTVVSPPERMVTGGVKGRFRRRTSRAIAA